jgi:hypothetical protein
MLRTKSGLPKHCSENIDRHGKHRVRFRKDGFSTYLTGTPWSEDFMRQYAAALDGVTARKSNIGQRRPRRHDVLHGHRRNRLAVLSAVFDVKMPGFCAIIIY